MIAVDADLSSKKSWKFILPIKDCKSLSPILSSLSRSINLIKSKISSRVLFLSTLALMNLEKNLMLIVLFSVDCFLLFFLEFLVYISLRIKLLWSKLFCFKKTANLTPRDFSGKLSFWFSKVYKSFW